LNKSAMHNKQLMTLSQKRMWLH